MVGSLCGACLALACVRLMFQGAPIAIKMPLVFLSVVASQGPHVIGMGRLVARLAQRLAVGLAKGMEFGPKHVVRVHVTAGGVQLGEDVGVLRLDGGQLRFDGLRIDFAIPMRLLHEKDRNSGKVYVQVEDRKIGLAFEELQRIGPMPSFMSLSYAFGNFWIGESAGDFRPPPTEAPPRIPLREWLVRGKFLLFWLGLSALCVAQSFALRGQGLKEAQLVLGVTFTVTVLIATIAPIVRLRKLFKAAPTAIEANSASEIPLPTGDSVPA